MVGTPLSAGAAFIDTIVALCTPQGNGAIALIRVSGPQAWEICAQFIKLPSVKNLLDCATHTVHYAQVEKIDNVLILALRAPRTLPVTIP